MIDNLIINGINVNKIDVNPDEETPAITLTLKSGLSVTIGVDADESTNLTINRGSEELYSESFQ